MLVARTRLPARSALLTAILTAVPVLTAQVPEGHAVVGTHADPTVSGAPGLFLVPLSVGPTTPIPITGLPTALRYTGGGFRQGVASVSHRSADGAIVVGTVAQAGGPTAGAVELYVLHLNGSAVARTQRIALGTTTNEGGVMTVILPDDRILVAGGQQGGPFPSGPMAGHLLAIVDTSGPSPTVTPLPNPTGASGSIGGLAVDPTGRFLFLPLTANINSPSRVAYLYRLDLATNQSQSIASWPGQVAQGLTCDDDGTVYVSATDPTGPTHFVHTVRPNGASPATVTSRQSALALVPQGLDLDRASGWFVAASGVFPGYSGPQINALSLIDPAGAVTVVASPPPGGWGVISRQGVAVNNIIESYGPRSDDQAQHHWFENFPNPGGQPTVGNAAFSLTVRSAPNPAATSALLLSFGRGSANVLGIELLVDLGSATAILVPSGPSVSYALAVPNDTALRGGVLTAQSVHLEASGALAASRGLTLTVQ